MMRKERLISRLEGDFVVFLIGLRINSPLKVHKWWPVASAMPRMLGELYRQPDLGFVHAEMWFSRTTIMVQYWRSMEQLLAYAKKQERWTPSSVAGVQQGCGYEWFRRSLA